MTSNFRNYNHISSIGRLDVIIDENDYTFEERDDIPDRSELTYTNGFYIDVIALFVDIRSSSKLPSRYRRPTLAKIYRAYVSEVVAILNGCASCAEINIVGDSVSAIFHGRYKPQIEEVFDAAARVNSLIKILNYKMGKANPRFESISIGIGISHGRTLMVKAGYTGSGINDVVWMGDVVNHASNLCGFGNETIFDRTVKLSDVIYENLNTKYQGFCSSDTAHDCYEAEIINVAMDEWYAKNCN